MSRVNGTTGTVVWATTGLGEGIVEWSLDLKVELPDSTGMDSAGWKNRIEGLKDWSAVTKLHYDTDGEADFNGSGVGAVCYPGHGGTLVLTTDTGGGAITYTGAGIVESVRPIVNVAGTVDFEVSFQGNGVMTPS